MIESTDVHAVATTTTVTLARDGVRITIEGIPATRYAGDDQDYIDGPLAERIDDAARALLDAIVPRRDAGGESDGGKDRAPL